MSKIVEMSVTRALTKIKTLSDRISRQTSMLLPVTLKLSDGTLEDKKFVEPKEQFQSIDDMIKLRSKLRMAVLKSNLKTKVTIGGKKYNIIEALEAKEVIQFLSSREYRIRTQLESKRISMEQHNKVVEENIVELLKTVASNGTLDKASQDALSVPYRASNSKQLHSGKLDIEDYQQKLKESNEEFLENVDYILSESNALTKITV